MAGGLSPATTISSSNGWRWTYPRAEGARAPGVAAARMMRPIVSAAAKCSKHRQMELRQTTGFSGERADIAHSVTWILLGLGHNHTTAQYGGHLVATALQWNFQGNKRLSFWMKVDARTCRRARRALEDAKLISSHLLLPGEMVPGQRGPVLRPQVVRNVEGLLALIPGRLLARRGKVTRKGRRGSSPPSGRSGVPVYNAATVPQAEPMTSEAFAELAARCEDPRLSALFQVTAAVKAAAQLPKRPQPEKPRPVSSEEIDAVDAELERLELLVEQRRRERAPPD